MPHGDLHRNPGARAIYRRPAVLVLAVVGTLVLAGLVFQAVAVRTDATRHPPPGTMVDVGGHRLHLKCSGDGGPTVVLEAGAQSFSTSWVWIQDQLSGTARVCSYDRAGLGWSEGGPEPRDAETITRELYTALQEAGAPGPYLLVGHSLGGVFVRHFARAHPGEVIGLVLVDPRHHEYETRAPNGEEEMRSGMTMLRVGTALARLGVLRLLGDFMGITRGLPPEDARAAWTKMSTPSHWIASTAEVRAFPATNSQASGDLGDLPLAIVSRDPEASGSTEAEMAWHEMQSDLTRLSSNSTHRVVEGSNHFTLLTNREHAGAIVEEVVAMLSGPRAAER